ncbi:TonB family protein [Hymenobacter lapidiphilus]|uniref:TonB family protein n=1 Tax=Hymenobacter sp. CCM 8763 TaxID=2303334 RepID=UPI000E349C1A|nr:TonB family protein [Hymenobacter sp. CCM 8763]RFP64338.1 TonB family protein [Hymenobacter sp. CCM 8763]
MPHSTLPRLLLAVCLLASTLQPLLAQDSKKVYTYVEQMPQLPGAGGTGAVQAAILKNFRYPADASPAQLPGQVYVQFNVTQTGQVEEAKVVKGLSPGIDAAALDAVRRLPRFVPGKQNGQAVTVRFTIPLKLALNGQASTATTGADNPPASTTVVKSANEPVPEVAQNKVYTYVEQMPQLPGARGNDAVMAAVQKNLVLPADTPEGRVFASFTVTATGEVTDVSILKGLSPATDAAVLAAVSKLPRFEPGKQNGRTVAVKSTVAVNVYRPDHVFEAREVATRARFPEPGLFAYLQRNLKVPAVVSTEKLRGWVGVDLVVLASGKVSAVTLTKKMCGSCDAEVLRLVQSFPAWVPARDQGGRAVAARQHLEIPLPLPDPGSPFTTPENIATYVQQPATLLDGTPIQELGALLTKRINYPETARREQITGTAQLEFLVDANGIVREPRLTQSVCRSCDQAILDALKALGPFVPARQGEQGAVPIKLNVSVPFTPIARPAGGK